MKKYILLFLTLTFFISINSYSQEHGGKDRFKTLKIGFITETLDLTTKEAESFWPIYNKYQDQIHLLRLSEKSKLLKNIKERGGLESLSDIEAETLLNNVLDINKQIHENEQNMFSDLKGVLSAKKLLKLYRAEKDFNRKILEQYKKRRQGSRRID
jgi:hypothetical protein